MLDSQLPVACTRTACAVIQSEQQCRALSCALHERYHTHVNQTADLSACVLAEPQQL